MDDAIKLKIDQCSRTAEDFTKVFYTSVDKRRHQLGKLYMDNGILIWNGFGVRGKDAIQKYFLELPASEHHLHVLDCQPVFDKAVSDQLTFLVVTAGMVKYCDSTFKAFQQNFIISAQGDKWKIASDCYRLHDSFGSVKLD